MIRLAAKTIKEVITNMPYILKKVQDYIRNEIFKK